MKKVFSFFFFLMLPLATLGAQGLHGRILLLQDSNSVIVSNLKTALQENYSGKVDSEYSLPTDLSSYDAILMVHGFVDSTTIPFSGQLRLIDYLKNGGKFYWEDGHFLTQFYNGNDSTPRPHDTLASFIGLKSESVDAVNFNFVRFFGVNTEFTNGFEMGHASDPFNPNGSTDFPRGNFIPVLYGEEDDFALDDAIAWIPADTSIHAVMHHALYYEYYAPFLTRVLCDYFGLCTDAVSQPKSASATNIRIVSDGNQTWIDIDGTEMGELEIDNALGISVFHCKTAVSGARVQVPDALPSGFYFARLRTNGSSEMLPFPFVQK